MPNKDLQDVLVTPKIAGIKSALPNFSLAWQMNHSFNFNLCLNLDWEKPFVNKNTSLHRHYYCYFEDVELNWHLIQNKGNFGYFFQSKPMFDYLFICDGEDIYNYFERAIDSMKNNGNIEHIFPFHFQHLPNKEAYFSNILNTKYFKEDLNV